MTDYRQHCHDNSESAKRSGKMHKINFMPCGVLRYSKCVLRYPAVIRHTRENVYATDQINKNVKSPLFDLEKNRKQESRAVARKPRDATRFSLHSMYLRLLFTLTA